MGELLESPRPHVSPEAAADVAGRVFGVRGDAIPLPGERDANFRIDAAEGAFCLKIANRLDTVDIVEMQALALEHVSQVAPEVPVPAVVRTLAGEPAAGVEVDGVVHAVQLVGFLSGVQPEADATTPAVRKAIGAAVGRLDRALRSFFHPAVGRALLWDVTRLPELRPHTIHVPGEQRALVGAWLERFAVDAAPAARHFRAQAIHNDLHQGNLLVDPEVPERITGIVDFGDMVHAPLVVDLAVSSAYQLHRQDELVAALADVVTAYDAVNPLEDDELRVLPLLVGGRLVQSVVIAAWRATLDPANAEYVLLDRDDAWDTLVRLSELDATAIGNELIEACRGGERVPAPAAPDLETSLMRRRRRLGPALSLSYETPVRPVRGDGVWLIEADGTRYLDAYNNVPHVGHSRPEVVDAVSRQMRALTTNTRYLVDEVTAYADRLAGLLPDPLEVVMFVNSGSEANDVAYQIATVVTGRRGVILTEHAYHGCTWATTAMSPEEFGLGRLEAWGATVPAPHPTRTPSAVESVDADVDAALAALAVSGHEPAMWIADSIFSSDGIVPSPPGYLRAAYERVRGAGGLCVADEVQAGFGRLGTPYWGFAFDDVVPDIVTLGKPMGNGHPMGAVITTRAIAEQFAAGWHFFSTFAGSPVAAAAGAAVLDVLEHERLPEHAEEVGALLRARIDAFVAERGVPASVRGAGLFVGVELTHDDGSPAAALAEHVVNGLRARHVLIGRTGPHGNVLKIRPPLVFSEQHVDLLANALAETLAHL